MNNYKLTRTILIITFFINSNAVINAQTITAATGSWNISIPPITEAGNNYAGTYESATNQIVLGVSVPLLLGNAKVSVHFEHSPVWNNSLVLSIRRTNNGSTACLLCSISGGTNYQSIGLLSFELFRIQAVLALASYSGINFQLQLSGVSVTVPAEAYQSRVVFTVSSI